MEENGRFAGRDIVKGGINYPLTINEYVYCGNMPFYYIDLNGMFWHIVCGAVVGAVVNTAISLGSSLLSGEKITPSQVVSSLVGGAITGGVTVATGIPTVGSLVGGSVETVVKGKMERKSNAEIVQDVAVGAVVDVAFINMGKYITNTSQIKQVTDCVKKTKI